MSHRSPSLRCLYKLVRGFETLCFQLPFLPFQPTNHGDAGSLKLLERWEDTDVRLLIITYADNKHMFGGEATKKDVFEKIAEQFTKISSRVVTGEQCMRKWGKITSKQKEIEDHNNKSGNDKKTWKFYDELSGCLAKDPTVSLACTLESSMQLKDQNSVKLGKWRKPKAFR